MRWAGAGTRMKEKCEDKSRITRRRTRQTCRGAADAAVCSEVFYDEGKLRDRRSSLLGLPASIRSSAIRPPPSSSLTLQGDQ
eukprot:767182-Hanusia_phi.AAC.4